MRRSNPLQLFLILSLSAFLLGAGVKAFLKSQFLNQYIANKLLVVSSKTTKLSYEKFALYVSQRHFLPSLVLQVDNAVFKTPDKCQSQLVVQAQKIISPVNVFKALWYRQNLQLDLEVDQLDVMKQNFSCQPEKLASKSSSVAGNVPEKNSHNKKLNQLSESDFKRELKKALKKIPALSQLVSDISKKAGYVKVNKIRFSDATHKQPRLTRFDLNQVRISFAEDGFTLRSSASWPFYKVSDKDLFFPVVNLTLDEGKLRGRILAQVKEGHMSINIETNRLSEKINALVKIRQLPVSELVMLSNQLLSKEMKVNPVLSWVNCEFKVSSKIDDLLEKSHELSQCQVVGELGEWTVSPYSLRLQDFKNQPDPVYISIKKARLENVIKLLNLPKKKSIFNKYGLFSGQIKIRPQNKSWEVVGEINNLELKFSRKNKVAYQAIESLQMKSFGDQQAYTIVVNNINLKKGLFKGEVTYSQDQLEGQLKANFSELSFKERLQDVFLGGVTSPLKGKIDGKYIDGNFSMAGEVFAKTLKSDYVSLENINMDLSFKDQALSGFFNIERSKFLSTMFENKDLSLEKIISKEKLLSLVVDPLTLKFEYSKGSLVWKAETKNQKPGGVDLRFSTYGTINYGRSITSHLSLFNPEGLLGWSWSGSPDQFSLTLANFEELKELDPKSKGLVEKKKSVGSLEKHLLEKAIAFKSSNKTSFPARMIKKAKEILPLKGK